jgi:hypothetical protein
VNGQPRRQQPIAEALQWVTRITTVALMTMLPVLGGRKLDEMRGTGYWGTIGLVVGLLLGAWQMRQLVVDSNRAQARLQSKDKRSAESDEHLSRPSASDPRRDK